VSISSQIKLDSSSSKKRHKKRRKTDIWEKEALTLPKEGTVKELGERLKSTGVHKKQWAMASSPMIKPRKEGGRSKKRRKEGPYKGASWRDKEKQGREERSGIVSSISICSNL